MYGLKGLEIVDHSILSPSMRTEWIGGRIEADTYPSAENAGGIWVTYSLAEAVSYSRDVFVVAGYGRVVLHDTGFRAEMAQIVAHVDLGCGRPEGIPQDIPTINIDSLPEFVPNLILADGDGAYRHGDTIFIPAGIRVRRVERMRKAIVAGTVDEMYTVGDAAVMLICGGHVGHILSTQDRLMLGGQGSVDKLIARAEHTTITGDHIRIGDLNVRGVSLSITPRHFEGKVDAHVYHLSLTTLTADATIRFKPFPNMSVFINTMDTRYVGGPFGLDEDIVEVEVK